MTKKKKYLGILLGLVLTLNVLPVSATEINTTKQSLAIEDEIQGINLSAYDLYIAPGESTLLSAEVIPSTLPGYVKWTRTAVSGVNLEHMGNTVRIHIASNMPIGNEYTVFAMYGELNRGCQIHIVAPTK